MATTKKEKAKLLLEKLNSLEAKKSLGIQSEITNLTEKLKDNFAVKTLKSVERISAEIEKFKTDFNLKPVMDAVRQLEKEMIQGEQDLRDELNTKLLAIPQTPDLTEEVRILRTQFDAKLQNLGLDDVKKDIENFKLQLQTYIDSDIATDQTEKDELDKRFLALRKDINTRLSSLGGGSQNQRIQINGTVMSTKYADFNLKGALTAVDNNITKQVDISIATGSIGGTITSGTAGSVLFISPTEILAQDNANFFYNSSTHKLGLGTTSPQEILHISGSGAPSLRITETGSAKSWNLTTNGAGSFELDQVGVGAAFLAETTTLNALFYANVVANNNNSGAKLTMGGLPSAPTAFAGLWLAQSSPDSSNYLLLGSSTQSFINAPSGGDLELRVGNVSRLSVSGVGVSINEANNTVPTIPLTIKNAAKSTTIFTVSDVGNIGLVTSAQLTFGTTGALLNTADGEFQFQNNANNKEMRFSTDHIYLSHESAGNAIVANGAGIFLISNEAQTIGFTLNGSAADVLAVKNRANNADASITGLGLALSGDASKLTVNAFPVPVVLSSTTGINAKTVANTALYTVPTGKTAIILGYAVRVSVASSITVGPSAGIGNIAGTNNIGASQNMTALLTTSDTFQWDIIGMSKNTTATGIIYFNLGTGSTGTSQTIIIDLIGYLI